MAASNVPVPADTWCKKKVGTPHIPKASLDRWLGKHAACRFVGKEWLCVHCIICGECGRVLKYEWQMTKEDCPVYHEDE